MPYGIKFLPQLLSFSFLIWFISCFLPKKISGVFLHDKTIYLLPAFALYTTLTLLWSSEVMTGAKVLERMISFVIMPFLFITLGKKTKIKIEYVYLILGLSIAISTISIFVQFSHMKEIILFQHMSSIAEIFKNVRYFIQTHDFAIHPSYLSYLSIIYLSVSIFHSKFKNTIHIVFTILAIVLIIALNSRGALLTLLFILAYLLFKQLYLKKYALFLIIAFFLTSFFYITYAHTRLGDTVRNFNNSTVVKTEDPRITVWRNSFSLIKEKPIFGYGIGDAIHVMVEKHEENNFKHGVERRLDAHNQFLETWLQSGLIGLILLILVFTFPFIQAIRKRQELLFLFLSVSFIQLLFESMFVRLAGVVYFAFFYCYLYYVYYAQGGEWEEEKQQDKLAL